jgi:hypothetical protein
MQVLCSSSGPVSPEGWAVLRVTSINDGTRPVAWPIRLHPSEATVSFIVDGVRHRGAEQVDSIVETVSLDPGQAVSTGVLVSVSDRGVMLPDVGEIEIQLAITPPGTTDEVLSNTVIVEVVDDEATHRGGRTLAELDAAAVALRDGESSDSDEVLTYLTDVDPADRAWTATALLPAAPLPEDGLLEAARQSVGDDLDDNTGMTRAVLDGVPYDIDDLE